jgi:uncharacterized protein
MIDKEQAFSIEDSLTLRQHINLLIIQPTPFCNINCDYCYLPERDSTRRMSLHVLEKTIERVLSSRLVGKELSIVWHAGEPLALPTSFYDGAFNLLRRLCPELSVRHSFQTNGMLLNDRWCELIGEHRIQVGVSLDGPAFIHDAHRKTRAGVGTHAQVMKGVSTLRDHGIDFHAIAVITTESLDHADDIFNFFLENGISRVGFNLEEIEGVNRNSTLSSEPSDRRIGNFFRRLHHLQLESGGRIKIREFDRAYQAIAHSTGGAHAYKHNDQVVPFGIVSVDCEGNFSTFSPELLGMQSTTYGDFSFGNVLTHDLAESLAGEKFRRVFADIEAGVGLCAQTCEYYSFCGGGAPSNKYYENGSFATAETMYCRYTLKLPLDIVLAELERSLGLARARA